MGAESSPTCPEPNSQLADAPFSEPPEGTEPAWIGRDEKGRVLPGFPGPRYSGKATSTIARAAKLVDASQPLVERRDTILRGGPDAKRELVRMLANSIVALDHFEREIGARLVLEGPLTGKGYSRAALTTAGNLATQKTRLIDKLLPLLEPSESSAPSFGTFVAGLTDDEAAVVLDIFERSAQRTANGEQPDPMPVRSDEPETFVVELPPETDDVR